jgi:hypothetical protein
MVVSYDIHSRKLIDQRLGLIGIVLEELVALCLILSKFIGIETFGELFAVAPIFVG